MKAEAQKPRSQDLKAELDTKTQISRTFGNQQQCAIFKASFKSGRRQLTYLTTDHISERPSEAESIKATIDQAFKNQKPKNVIVEGKVTCEQIVSVYLLPKGDVANERDYTIKLAIENGSHIVRGEPMGLEAKNEKDVEGFLLMRTMYGLIYQSHKVSSPRTGEEMMTLFGLARATVNQQEQPVSMSFGSFMDWYKKTNKVLFKTKNLFDDMIPSQTEKTLPNPALIH